MKKKIISIVFFCFLAFPFFAQNTDSSIYNELISAYKTEFYPGVVDKALTLEKNFPNSPYILQSSFLKAQAYFYLFDYDSAVAEFEKVLPFFEEDSEDYLLANYLEGRAFFAQKKYTEALQKFYLSCKKDYYNQSICFAAQCFYLLGNKKEAIPLFEYIIQNGNKYAPQDYSICAVQLINCYKNCGEIRKAENLFTKLDASDSVFSKAEDLKWNFYVQLGIDNYNQKDFENACLYFEKATKLKEAGFAIDDAILQIYNLKIRIEKNEDLFQIENELIALEPKIKQSVYPGISDAFYSTLLKLQILNGNWDSVIKNYGKLQKSSCETDYLISAYYYNNEDFKNALKYVSKYALQTVNNDNLKNFELLGSIYAKTQNYKNAEEIYRKIEIAGLLKEKSKAEYAKVLFVNKKFNKSYEIALNSSYKHKDYLCALNKVNLQDWDWAKKHLVSYISSMGTKEDFNNLAIFYKGYVEYVLEDYKNAYISFVRFSGSGSNIEQKYLKQTYELGAKSALQNGDYKAAAILAENLVKVSVIQQQKEEALIFCADIYSDSGEYEKAVSILQPYTKDKSDFSVRALFQTAKIYEKCNQIKNAENTYAKIISDFSKSTYAEEAMYDCGELYYLNQDFSTAENRFNKYIFKYPKGRFVESALFFGGDCNLKIGSFDKSIMLNSSLVSRFPQSIYLYGAYKNLVNAYYETEDFESALNFSQLANEKFPKQAAEDEMGRKIIELQRIVSGLDSSVAKKVSEYEKAGKTNTVRGRSIGSELVKLYTQNPETIADAVLLAEQLLEKQTQQEEKLKAAENAEFLADYYRKNSENKKAAQMYLKAAEYYRGTLDADANNAAAVLYSAVEAFAAGNQSGDAKETAKLLKQLYPDSKYAASVDNLLR